MIRIQLFLLGALATLIGCAGSSNGDDLEVPTNLPPICRNIDFTAQPDMREICGVRRVRYKAYHNIPQQRYLIKPSDASIVKDGNRVELRLPNSLPIELTGPITRELAFGQDKRLEKIRNTYDYVEIFNKETGRKRVFKLGIPVESGKVYDFCFRIPEKMGSDRTRSVAMGNNILQISCAEFDEAEEAKKRR